MLTVTINNSTSKVTGFDVETFKALREALSYDTDASARFFAGGNYPTKRYLIDKHGTFATGLLKRVLTTIPKAKVIDNRARPALRPPVPLLGNPPYPWQDRAVERAYKAKQAGIVACTGSGKSKVIAALIAKLAVKTLIIVPTLELKRQLTQTLKEALGPNAKLARVENIDSTKLASLTDFDCLILDEVHHAAAKTYRKLNAKSWTNIYYRFFLTATYFRNQESEQLLFECIAGQPCFELTYTDAVAAGYIVPVEAYYIDVPKTKTDGYTWTEVYKDLIVNNEARNILIDELLRVLDQQQKSTLCLIKEVAHGQIVAGKAYCPFAHGQDVDSSDYIEIFSEGNTNTLVATTGVVGEGVDTRACEYVIIAGLGKAKSAFMQQVGRAVRRFGDKESAKVIIFKDLSHKWTKSHYKAQCKILLDEYGVVPVKLDL